MFVNKLEVYYRDHREFQIFNGKKYFYGKFFIICSEENIHKNDLLDAFINNINQTSEFADTIECNRFISKKNISFKDGVTDNLGENSRKYLELSNKKINFVKSGDIVYADFEIKDELSNFAFNPLIQNISNEIELGSFDNSKYSAPLFSNIDFNIGISELITLSSKNCWAFSKDELVFLKEYFVSDEFLLNRKKQGLSNYPTNVEIEIIAQTWSEHCKHKIFSSEIEFEHNNETYKINSIFKDYIKRLTNELIDEGLDWTKSVFKDNAGVVDFDSNIYHCIKVETHNSPSALDPYGGAMTGVLGVQRDIVGTGMGALPIANTDVFCLPPTQLESEIGKGKMPVGPMNPVEMLNGVHRGVKDGGNKMGIPTISGDFYFDTSYCGKPLVYCGSIGVIPKKINDDVVTYEKKTAVGDYIYMCGGKVGIDGIHGATFSSLELNEDSPTSAVQIGDPFTQKKVFDFLLEARDQGLYTGLTDNGAGGLSSSVGEMAEFTNGAKIDLSNCSLKYDGIEPWQIMVSESQERMTVSVAPHNIKAFEELAHKRNVIVNNIGQFTESGFLEVYFKDQIIANLDLDFLHNQTPKMKLKAKWESGINLDEDLPQQEKLNSKNLISDLFTLLNNPNISSKEKFVRQYDHQVKGSTFKSPFTKSNSKPLNSSSIVWNYYFGGEKDKGVCISQGLAPEWSNLDPYYMSIRAIDNCVRDLISSGTDPDKIALLDNYCWPDPILSEDNLKGDYKLGQLVLSSKALYEFSKVLKYPLVSGKDSMKNDFKGKNFDNENIKISIKPTLLITGMGKVELKNNIENVFTQANESLYLAIPNLNYMNGNIDQYYSVFNEEVDLDIHYNFDEMKSFYNNIYNFIVNKKITSIRPVGKGGIITSSLKMCFGSNFGININNTKDIVNYRDLFKEPCCSFLITSKNEITDFPGTLIKLGTTTQSEISIFNEQLEKNKLLETWESRFE